MAKRKSQDFLPGIFQTKSNKKFLNATLDQIIQEPNMQQVYGYIGQQDISPNYQKSDYYITETDGYSQFYQLEPGLVVRDKLANSDTIVSTNAYSYVDMLNQINNDGGLTNNHSRLFSNEFYSYNAFVDMDKLVNYRQYYWVPKGPEAVSVSADTTDVSDRDFYIYRNRLAAGSSLDLVDIAAPGYRFDNIQGSNPTLYLTRGQTYNFHVSQYGTGFYIQTEPGLDNKTAYQNNLDRRNVLGVSNNGTSAGVVSFHVPFKDQQDNWYNMPEYDRTVDLVTSLSYSDLQGIVYADFIKNHTLDGNRAFDYISKNILIFNTQGWPAGVTDEQKVGLWNLSVDANGIMRLVYLADFPRNHKTFVREGETYGHTFVFRNTLDRLEQVPNLTAVLDTLYYQDASDANYFGEIRLVDPDPNSVLQISDILSQAQYTSPNGVKFTSGLKVSFTGNVNPPEYATGSYVVENVGHAIKLLPWDEFVTPEPFNYYLGGEYSADPYDTTGFDSNQNNPVVLDYMTVSRASDDRNAWSRNNRWFHKSVLEYAAELTGKTLVLSNSFQAKRPIVEFTPDLQLYNYGKRFLKVVNVFDNSVTDAFNDVLGVNNLSLQKESFFLNTDSNAATGDTQLVLGDISRVVIGQVVTGQGIAANTVVTKLLPKINSIEISQPLLSDLQGGTQVYFGYYNCDGTLLQNGINIIFNNDKRAEVRKTIYQVENVFAQSYRNTNLSTVAFSATGDRILRVASVTNLRVSDKVTGTGVVDGCTITALDYTNNLVYLSNYLYSDVPVGTTYAFNNTATQINLIPVATASQDDVIVVNGGIQQQGAVYRFHDGQWVSSQQKLGIPQAPLFDVVDAQGFSLGDQTAYPSTNFAGNRLFGYAVASGNVDKELGVAIKYQNIGNIGDIQFYNFYENDQFVFTQDKKDQQLPVSRGYAIRNLPDGKVRHENGWSLVRDKSVQKVVYTNTVTATQLNDFYFQIAYKYSSYMPNIRVKLNDRFLSTSEFSISADSKKLVLTFPTDLSVGDSFTVMVAGVPGEYKQNFQMPLNLTNNGDNQPLEGITLGQMRNHLIDLANNCLEFSGEPAGINNLRDIQYLNGYGKLLQHSAGMPAHALQSVNLDTNLVNIIKQNMQAYGQFKINLQDLISNSEFADANDYRSCLDLVLEELNQNIKKTDPYYYTDMVPYGVKHRANHYTVINVGYRTYNINVDYSLKSTDYVAVLVYRNNLQLVRDRDYVVEGFVVRILDDFLLYRNDVISIYEYTDTRGCGIPATPSKMGNYPLFVPEIYLDQTYRTPVMVLRGHDGSITPCWNDYRDQILLEYEQRVYNNALEYYANDPQYDLHSVQPGAFRKTDYSAEEWSTLLSAGLLEWSGFYNVDLFTNNTTVDSDSFTYNYSSGVDSLFAQPVPGNWRGMMQLFFDTDRPHLCPWEMLGMVNQPDWWQGRYGPAPYTNQNTLMWTDLEMGFIYNGSASASYINTRYARPGLSQILPVDEHGVLLSPENFLVTKWRDNVINKDWRIGDWGPSETAWRRSSFYPYAVQIAWALAKPAEYAAMKFNTRDVRRDQKLGQVTNIRYNNRAWDSDLVSDTEFRPGTNMWIYDSLRAKNLDVTENWYEYVKYSRINLMYKLAGFTDKRYLQLTADQVSPQTTNSSIMIPQENYDVVFTKSSVIARVVYSAVTIVKTSNGYKVYGFDNFKPYFLTLNNRINDNNYTIKVGNDAVTIYNDGSNNVSSYPYGTVLRTKQDVADFLISYGRYLAAQGFLFQDVLSDDNTVQDWSLSVKEFLFWSQQNWGNDTIISLTPAGTSLKFNSLYGAVEALSNRSDYTRVVNSDGRTLKISDYRVYREGNDFEIDLKDQQKGIHLLDIAVVQYEHSLVVDNSTVFNDVIFDPAQGNRQYRLKLQGHKTADWDGSLYAPGFLVNVKSIEPWQSFTDYYRGDVVVYKNRNYTAKNFTPGSSKFDSSNWYQISGDLLKNQLIPNPAFGASQFTGFYDVNTQDINTYADTFARHGSGFSARNYLTDLGLDVVSQHKFYLGMLKQKGSQAVINAYIRAQKVYNDSSMDLSELFAIRMDTFGNTAQQKLYELDVSAAVSINDQYPLVFLDKADAKQAGVNNFKPMDFLQIPAEYSRDAFVGSVPQTRILGTSGPVRSTEISATVFNIQKLYEIDALTKVLGEGSLIWVANDVDGQWAVYRVTLTDRTYVVLCTQTGPNELTFTTNIPHGFQVLDMVMLHSSDNRNAESGNMDLGGFYKISSVNDLSFSVKVSNNINIGSQSLYTLVYKLQNVRFATKHDFTNVTPARGWKNGDLVYINQAAPGYEVLQNKASWQLTTSSSPSYTVPSDLFSSTVLISHMQNYAVVGCPGKSGTGSLYLYSINYLNDWRESARLDPTDVNVLGFASSMSMNDQDLVAIGAPGSFGQGMVYLAEIVNNDIKYRQILHYDFVSSNFGTSVELSGNGDWLYVGDSVNNQVYAYRYQQITETYTEFWGDGSNTDYAFPSQAEGKDLGANDVAVFVGDVLMIPNLDYVMSATSDVITLDVAPAAGQAVRIYYRNYYKLVSVYTKSGAVSWGESISTEHTGKMLVVGDSLKDGQGAADVLERTQRTVIAAANQTVFKVDNIGKGFSSSISTGETYYNDPVVYIDGQLTYSYTFSTETRIIPVIREIDDLVVVAVNNHGLADGDAVVVNGPVPTDLVNGNTYYVQYVDADNFKLYYEKELINVVHNTDLGNYIPNSCSISYQVLVLDTPATAGSEVVIEYNDLISIAELTPTAQADMLYAQQVRMSNSGGSVIVGAPGYKYTNNQNGALFSYVNVAREYGQVTTSIRNPVVPYNTTMYINDRLVRFVTGTTQDIVQSINSAAILGVTAKLENGYVTIYSDSMVASNRLRLRDGTNSPLSRMGLEQFKFTQLILSPSNQDTEQFGEKVNISPDDRSIIVGATISDSKLVTTFDNGTMTWDNKTIIQFSDKVYRSGSAHIYELQQSTADTAGNPAKFAYATTLTNDNLTTQARFGTGVAISQNWVLVGSPNGMVNKRAQGVLYVYHNADSSPVWQTIRTQPAAYNSNVVKQAYLFNRKTQEKVIDLTVIDPEHGKFAPNMVDKIDYFSNYDPASYSNAPSKVTFNTDSKNIWTDQQVGKIWWDTNSIKVYDFNQGDTIYRLNNWNQNFPNSTVAVYQWIESDVLPSVWAGQHRDQQPLYVINEVYSSKTVIDQNTGATVTRYYFWVRNGNLNGISTKEIENVLAEARNQQEPYLAVLDTNAIGLYNCQNYIDTDISLIIKTSEASDTVTHTEWATFDDGSDLGAPVSFYDKIKHSLTGQDDSGRPVPDLNLPEKQRYGTSIRPRQTMFADKYAARKLFVEQLNSYCRDHAFALIRKDAMVSLQDQEPVPAVTEYSFSVLDLTELSYLDLNMHQVGDRILVISDAEADNNWSIRQVYLDAQGAKYWFLERTQSYNLTSYWSYDDWYSADYTQGTKPAYTIDTETELNLLPLVIGDVILIRNSSEGGWKLVIATNTQIQLLAQQNATIRFNSKLYDNSAAGFGLDGSSLDSMNYSQDCAIEFGKIFDIVAHQLLDLEFRTELKTMIRLLINTMMSQVQDADWIMKTSLVDIYHRVRNLDQLPVFLPDQENSITDFFNEIKPFHTIMKQYVARYDNRKTPDIAGLDITDFDLQPYYNIGSGKHRSPQLGNSLDVDALKFPVYQPWLQNHTYGVVYINVVKPGAGYVPNNVNVIITGDGTGAKARAVVKDGAIDYIQVVNPGTGYTTAVVSIYGTNTSMAVASVRLGNGKARNINSTLRFDRYTYQNHVSDWAPGTDYQVDQVVVYSDPAFRVTTAHRSNDKFNMLNFALLVVKVWYPNTAYNQDDVIIYRSDLYGMTGPVAYVALADFSSSITFDLTYVRPYDGKWLDNAADRIWSYYSALPGMAGRDLSQLMRGISYPGVQVLGPGFDQAAGYDMPSYDEIEYDPVRRDQQNLDVIRGPQAIDTIYQSVFADNMLGLRPEDIITDGGKFLDAYSSHAPEELIPGRMFDTLEIKVTTNASSALVDYINPENRQVGYVSDGVSLVYSYAEAITGVDMAQSGPEYIWVAREAYGPMEEGVDYTVNRTGQYIKLAQPVPAGRTMIIHLWGSTGFAESAHAEYVSDGITRDYLLPGIGLVDCKQFFVKIDDVITQDFIASDITGGVNLSFNFTPVNGTRITIHAYAVTSSLRSFARITEQTFTTAAGQVPSYDLTLSDPITSVEPLTVYTIPRVNNQYLTPSNQAYYTASGSTRRFNLNQYRHVADVNLINDSDILVIMDKQVQQNYQDYTIIRTTDEWPIVEFIDPPAYGSQIVISDSSYSEYKTINANSVQLEPSIALLDVDKVHVSTITNHDMIDIKTWVFTGNLLGQFVTLDEGWDGDNSPLDTKPFDNNQANFKLDLPLPLPMPVTNPADMIVTINGMLQLPYIDFTLPTSSTILFKHELADTDIIVFRIFSGENRNRNSQFRIFKDLQDNVTYQKIDSARTTKLVQDLNITDRWIYVEDVNVLYDSDPSANNPGVVFINGERITYGVKDLVNNRLGQLRRATAGTGAPQVHTTFSLVVDANKMQDIPGTQETVVTMQGMVAANTGLTFGQFKAANVVAGTAMMVPANEVPGTIYINTVAIPVTYLTSSVAANRSRITNAINSVISSTGVHALDTGSDITGITLTSDTGDTITVTLDGGYADANGVDLGYTGLAIGVNTQSVTTLVSGSAMVAPASSTSGRVTLNGITINFLLGTDIAVNRQNIVTAINSHSNTTNVTAVDTGSDATGVELNAGIGGSIDITMVSVVIDNRAGQTINLENGTKLRRGMLWQMPGQTLNESQTQPALFIRSN